MLSDVRLPVRDQTIESLVAVMWLFNGFPTWEAAASAVLGHTKSKNVRGLLHSGWREAFVTLNGAGNSTPNELLAAHSYLPLYQPFTKVAVYEQLRTTLLDGDLARLLALARTRVLAGGPVRYCPLCAAKEVLQSGYAVAHRSNQISGVMTCSEHGVGLISFAATGRFAIKFGEKGLHIPSASALASHPQSALSCDVRSPKPAELRYAKFVEAALSGELAHASLGARQVAFSDRLDERFQARGAPGSTLSRLIREGHSAAALREAALDVPPGRAAYWPALVTDGDSYAHHPVANLLVISVLFDDVDDYNRAITKAAGTHRALKDESAGLHVGVPNPKVNSCFIKDCIRGLSLKEVALRHDMNSATVKALLLKFPRLAHQREQAGLRRRLRRGASALKQSPTPRATEKEYGCERRELRSSTASLELGAA
jgi:hypothetical protein